MTCRLRFLSVVAFMLSFVALTRGAEKPVPAIQHAIIISVDGLRPDLMLRANAPNIRAMLERGSYSLWARTTPASITLPSHVSMVTGVNPEAHGILWNGELPFKEPVYPNYPTIFELAKRAGLTTAVVAGKEKFNVLDKPGALDWKYFANTTADSDREVLEYAIRAVREHKPNVMMLHFASVDVLGHAQGWGSPEQMDAIAKVDGYLGQLFGALDELKLTDSTFILLSADHGGQGRVHGPDDPRSRTIPWIVVGPGIRKNYDLTLLGSDSNIETYDTFTTTCTMIGIPLQRRVKGKFVPQILENPELITPRDGATTQPSK